MEEDEYNDNIEKLISDLKDIKNILDRSKRNFNSKMIL